MALSRKRATRSSVATPATTRFIEPRYRRIRASVSIFSLRSKFDVFLLVVFLFFCLRFVFMGGGYIDLTKKNEQVRKKAKELAWVENENKTIRTDIKNIKSSSTHQRRLAREHLGVIGPDEYLVLFASDLATKSK